MSQLNTINDLRAELFATLKALRDKDHPMDIDRARAVVEVGRAIVDTAKVEVAFLEAVGGVHATGFIPDETPGTLPPGPRTIAAVPSATARRA